MRVAILTREFPPAVGIIGEYVRQLARHLGGHHAVTVWAPPFNGVSAEEPTPYTHRALPRTTLNLARHLRAWRPDRVIVGHTDLRLLLAARLALPRGYVVIAYGNDFLGAQKRWYRGLVNALLAQARPVVTISRSSARRLQHLGIPNPVVIYPGTDPARFTPPPEPPPLPYTLLSVGRLVQRKGLDIALRAVARLRRYYPDIRYVIVGRGPERPRLQRLARTLGVDGHVDFLGAVPDEDLPDVYRRAHVFVLPLREETLADSIEGFGMVFLEAAATAVPAVAGDSGGAAEAVRHEETGLVVPPGDEEAVYGAVRLLLDDPERRVQMGQAGRRWVETEMNWQRVVREFQAWL